MRPQRLGYRQNFRINTMGNETKAIPASIICTHSTSHPTLLLEIYHRLTTGVQSALISTIAGRPVQETNDHRFLINLELGKFERKYGQLSICPTVNYRIHSYTDSRTTEKAERRYTSFDPSISYFLQLTVGDSRYICISTGYKQDHTMPEMNYLLPLGDNSNPLSISLGNPDLKAACLHQSNIGFSYNNWPHNWELGISGTYTRMVNSTAMGYSYNAATGVYTYRPENVDGNWMTQLKLSYLA